jgi:hypothetical protein
MEPQALYTQLGRLAETTPNLLHDGPFTVEQMHWLGKVHALIAASGDVVDAALFQHEMDLAISNVGSFVAGRRGVSVRKLYSILYRQLAAAELNAPAASQGAFIPAGNAFDAMNAFSKAASGARKYLLIVDPYMDEKTLTDFAPTAPEGISIRLLADKANVKQTLGPAASRWVTQFGAVRPLSVRLTPNRTLHDRLLIVDGEEVYLITQSLNGIALKSPAAIVRVEGDTKGDKIAAYEAIWASSTPI